MGGSSESGGSWYSSGRGQTSTLGVALILGITVLAMTVIVGFGATALNSTEREAQISHAEDAMTQFDSRAGEVALGSSGVQSVDFGRGEGTYEVRPTQGTISIRHANYDGTDDDGNDVWDGSGDTDDELLYSGSLGAVVYSNGQTEIAYQGGGVWRKGPSGDAVMISPPEFHYRAGTLTLPVVRTDGTGSGSGSIRSVVKEDGPLVQQFPNEGNTYNTPSGSPTQKYLNPLANGRVYVTVQSDYYMAWAEFFRSRSDGAITIDHTKQEVELELLTKGLTGTFPLPADSANGGGSLEVRGIAPGHTLDSFSYTIVGKENQNSRFQNLRWSLYADEPNRRFEIAFPSGNVDCGDKVRPVIYYSWKDGGSWKYQAWRSVEGYDVICTNDDGDSKEQAQATVDLMDSSKHFEYTSISGSDLGQFKNSVGSFDSTGTLEDHPAAPAADNHPVESVSTGDQKDSDWIIKHYYALMGPDFQLRTYDQQAGNAAGVAEGDSGSNGYIDYPGGNRVITYLHVTENGIEVELSTD